MSAALLEELLARARFREVMDKLAALESASLSPLDESNWRNASTPHELRDMARQAGRGEPVSLA